jgi:Ni,Fe-hydrogenase III large subunit/Ni,Fe-hydrogenase III component G
MNFESLNSAKLASSGKTLPSNIAAAHAILTRAEWQRAIGDLRAIDAVFLSLWGADDCDRDGSFSIYATFLLAEGALVLQHKITDVIAPSYPSLARAFPAAARMERAVYDLLGIASATVGHESDQRGWLRHAGWPEGLYPLRRSFDGAQQYPVQSEPYEFVQVEGNGVHEIAVGPVHAGTIEPGHFRFSVVGEKVLRLEERLGYTHKGTAKLFESLTQTEAHRLAARLSGDSAVAFSWAYCAALEAITATAVPLRASSLRALALEHERIANHLGDLGALGNDAGFALGLTHFSRLKEDLLRVNVEAFGARYLLDYVVPGGVAVDLSKSAHHLLEEQYRKLAHEVAGLRAIYDDHGGLQDRFREAGRLTPELAQDLGAMGLIARASGVAHDLRVDHPWTPYDGLATQLVTQSGGDVAARVQVRFDDLFESLRLCQTLLDTLADGPIQTELADADSDQLGIGLGIAVIEGWRGPVMIALECGAHGSIRRCHAHDPSWQNWPLLEYAILGNIVPDFPLINKSFNLSYSGQDG